MNTPRQSGMSLTEMLISLAISMVVIGGVVSIYTSTIGSSSATLKASKLNQELTAVLSVMVNDIRRAGYSAQNIYTTPQDNYFSKADDTDLEIFDEYISGGDCIVYAYDRNKNGTVQDTDISGFRLVAGNGGNRVIQMRLQGNTAGFPNDQNHCEDAYGTWQPVTDDTIINITSLSFSDAGSECLNTSEPDGLDEVDAADADTVVDNEEEYDCITVAADSGEVTVETRQITITIEGKLATDPSVQALVTQTVRVRNDKVTLVP